MTALSFDIPEVGQPDKTEDPKIADALKAVLAWSQNSIDSTNLADEGIEGKKIKKNTITTDRLSVGTVLELLTTGTERKIAWGGPINSAGSKVLANGTSGVGGKFAHGMGTTPVFFMVFAAGQTACVIGGKEASCVPSFAATGATATEIEYEGNIPGSQGEGRAWPLRWVAIG